MKQITSFLLFALLALVACSHTTVHGITPISPGAGRSSWTGKPPVVEALQPTFRWKPAADATARYDFVIFEGYGSEGEVLGNKVYYREGLQQPEHTLEVSLQPDRVYYWSVRVRRGEEVSEWSRFDWSNWAPVPGGSYYAEYPFFTFRTPSKQ